MSAVLGLNPDPRGPPVIVARCPCAACRVRDAQKPKEESK